MGRRTGHLAFHLIAGAPNQGVKGPGFPGANRLMLANFAWGGKKSPFFSFSLLFLARRGARARRAARARGGGGGGARFSGA